MSAERNQQTEFIKRGGCLDLIVQVGTLGMYGVQTKAQCGYENKRTGEFSPTHPAVQAIQSTESVLVNKYTQSPKITRKIVRNK